MMKKQLMLSTIFSLVLFFAACQSEDENPKSPMNEKGKITFSLPAPSGTVSYATVTASADENLLKKLDIYMFNEGGMLEYVYDAVTANGSGASRTASIDVTGRSGAKTFYFAANAEGQSTELENVVVGTTTLSEFKEIVTEKQINLMKASDGLLMSAVKTITDVTAELTLADKTVNLRRRVARFDVLNDASVTNFEINKIMVSNANLRSYLFEDATGTPAKAIEVDKIPVVDFNTTSYPNANTATTAASVFYIYPTSLEAGKTEISIEGLFNGVTKVYTVSLPVATPIKANYRYILKAKKMDITHIEWEIAIDEWEDGSEVETGPGNPLFTFSGLSRTGGTGGALDVDAKTYDISLATTASVLSFRTSSINKAGTFAEVVYKHDTDHSSLPGFTVATPEPILTYGASYTQDYKIDIPVQTEKVPIKIEITVWDAVSPVRKEVIVIHSLPKYDKTAYEPVLVGGKYWAPVNVGATTVDATTLNQNSLGLHYQWGRNVGFSPDAVATTIGGPVSLAVANLLANSNKFITNIASPYNWLIVDGTVTTMAQLRGLWSDTNVNPCPVGWKVPTDNDLKKLSDRFVSTNLVASRLSIAGDSGVGTLYLPAAGQLSGYTGDLVDKGIKGNYQSSTLNAGGDRCYTFNFESGNVNRNAGWFTSARSVRCIQAD